MINGSKTDRETYKRLIAQGHDCRERSEICMAEGSSVGAREWLAAAHEAYDAAAALKRAVGEQAVKEEDFFTARRIAKALNDPDALEIRCALCSGSGCKIDPASGWAILSTVCPKCKGVGYIYERTNR